MRTINLFKLVASISLDDKDYVQGLNQAEGKTSGFKGTLGKVAGAVAGAFAVEKIIGFGVQVARTGIEYNSMIENSTVAWGTLLGSQGEAEAMLKRIGEFAKTTPFDQMGVDEMAKQLHNAGFEGDNLFNQLTKFGDIAGAFNIPIDSLKEMVRQYSQVNQAGVAYTEDLNILQDRGVPIYKAIAEQLGINVSEVKKWASEGKISADIYNSALDSVASNVEGGMAKMSETFTGRVSTMMDSFKMLAGELSKPLFDILKQGLEAVQPFIDVIIESIGEVGLLGTLQRFLPGAMPIINGVVTIFQQMGTAVSGIMASLSAFWQEHSGLIMGIVQVAWFFIQNFIMTAINAIVDIVQGGLKAIDGIINFFQALFSGNFQAMWEAVKQIFSGAIQFLWGIINLNFVKNIMTSIKGFAKNIPTLLKTMWESIKNFFKNGITNVLNFVKNLVTQASTNFNTLKTFGANAFQALWETGKNMASKLLQSVIQFVKDIPVKVKSFMDEAVNYLKGINLFDIGKNIIQGLINGIKNMGSAVTGAIKNIVSNALDSAKKFLGIGSPSKVFQMQVGREIPAGMAIGIDDGMGEVSDILENEINSLIPTDINYPAGNGNNTGTIININLNIDNFNNNTDKDIEQIAKELAFLIKKNRFVTGVI